MTLKTIKRYYEIVETIPIDYSPNNSSFVHFKQYGKKIITKNNQIALPTP